ncbi:MAG: GNAT family N-acetyltransferase [Anaerolineae bacterium]
MPYSIGRLLPSRDDACAILEIEAACFGASTLSPAEALRTLSIPEHRLYAARDPGSRRLIGFCSCFVLRDARGSRLELDLLAVLPMARGKGLATRMLRLALDEADSQGIPRARGVVRTGNRPSERAFARAGLTAGTLSYELLVYAPRGDHPVSYLPASWSDSLAGDRPPHLNNGNDTRPPESFFTHSYVLDDARARLRTRARVALVHTLSGSALWIERLQASSTQCAATAARGLVERAKQWGVDEVGLLAPDHRADRRMLPALLAEGFERLGRFGVYERGGAPSCISS